MTGKPEDIPLGVPGDAKARMTRILRLHDEVDTIKEMIREVYGEEKDAGGDKTAMGAAVSAIRKRAKDIEKFDSRQGMVDLYLTAFFGASHTHAYARGDDEAGHGTTQTASNFGHDSDENGADGTTPEHDAETGEITEQQVAPQPAQDGGAVSEVKGSARLENAVGVEPPPSTPKPEYAAPGAVTTEHAPPEPVRRHPISAAFAELGQDREALKDGIYSRFGGVERPIVKIGCEILDGWARYDIARGLLIDYPVVQYAGTDILADAVNWNLESRQLTAKEIATVVGRLCRLYPEREQEILGMFDAEMAEAAE